MALIRTVYIRNLGEHDRKYRKAVILRASSLCQCTLHVSSLRQQHSVLLSSAPRIHSPSSSTVILGSFTLHFGLKYEIIYQLDSIEYLFVFFQLDMFRAYTPIFRSNGCYNFFTYAAEYTHAFNPHTHILHTPYVG